MSGDLLRRAAAKLREAAEAATPGPWDIDGCIKDIKAANGVTIAYDDDTEMCDGRYITLVHPPVALALAGLLDRSADAITELEFTANTGRATESHVAHLADLLALRPLARAILREEGS